MKQQLVDPFIPAPGQLARHQAQRSNQSKRSSTVSSAPVSRGVSLDGVMKAWPQADQAPRRTYRGPAPSLHLQYAAKPQPTSPVIQARRREQVMPDVRISDISQAQPVQPSKLHKKPKGEGVSTLWLVIGSATAGLAMFSVMAGQLAIAVYAVAALWRRWPSQQTFGLALTMFGGIILASILPPFRNVADNLAVYAFLLLCVGTISLAREVRRDMRQASS